MLTKYWRVRIQTRDTWHPTRENERGRWRKQINSHQKLDERNSGEEEREETEYTSRQNASISRAITYLNAVPVISCCPFFDNNLQPPATTRFLATAMNENRNKTRAREQLCDPWLIIGLLKTALFSILTAICWKILQCIYNILHPYICLAEKWRKFQC